MLFEQSPPTETSIADITSSVPSIAFSDKDLDASSEVGGVITWSPPGDVTQVTYYVGYLATSAVGVGKSLVGSDVTVGTNTLSVLEDTVTSKTYVVVHAKSSFEEQTTPVGIS